MQSALQWLRQNHPFRTTLRIRLRDETSDGALAQALEHNPFVTEIILDLDGEHRADWDSLLGVIAMRANLKSVKVQDAISAEDRNASGPALVRSILRAFQQNTAIRRVYLRLRLPTDISVFLDNASSIKKLCLHDCDMDPAERQQGARDLAAALQRNKNIETLEIDSLNNIDTVPILEGLRSNVSLKIFMFLPCRLDAMSDALQELLESTISIQRFDFIGTTFNGEMFRPIAQSLIQSPIVCELKLTRCVFNGANSTAQFGSVLRNKRNLTSLSVESCGFDSSQFQGDIVSALSRPDSLIRCFEYQSHGAVEEAFSGVHFQNLLRAVEKSKLERFMIGSMETPQQLQYLTQSIPFMKLQELEIAFMPIDEDDEEGELSEETIRQDLLPALKNNFSLRSVKAEMTWDRELFWTAEDKKTLAFYPNRNKSLDRWVDNPEKIADRKVWPNALGLAQRAGPDALFRGLRSVFVREKYVLPKGGRKCQRPQNYTPTSL